MTKLRHVTSTTGEPAANHLRVMAARDFEGREASPSAQLDDASVKTAESCAPCGFDAGKRIKSRKRRILTDAPGFVVGAEVRGASVQDRDEGPMASRSRRRRTDLQGGPSGPPAAERFRRGVFVETLFWKPVWR